MQKKIWYRGICVFVAAIAVIAMVFMYVQNMKSKSSISEFNSQTLELDQNDAYVSLSKNDDSGYNRWIPFYFKSHFSNQLSESDIENELKNNIKEAKLYSKADMIYKTAELVWTVVKVAGEEQNLTLVLLPKVDECVFDNETRITRIEFICLDDKVLNYDFSQYILDQKETVDEKVLSITSTPMQSQVSDQGVASIDYEISGQTAEVSDVSYYYPNHFDQIDITDKKIVKSEKGMQVQAKAKIRSEKIVFRPFVVVKIDNQSVNLVPPVPTYFE
ncbi:hypothetical protein [Bifidobacterium oedipodis]|uniref:Uncharacterized protein n=1 Tax=Bifidobacterium oedipodis TaxID=2675322 RepID=A0A7Y0EPF4_9BIFI|nr:hypothetical protein [Bifidobacterium sp. DSM 109957]NMM92846.1 hypothetical protein [Bifidobacterium sp. DSM 109957]